MKTPSHLRAFQCDDYFQSDWSETGCFDFENQMMLVAPAKEIKLHRKLGFLAIGHFGVDGLRFGYRRGHAGVWLYRPLDDLFEHIATSTDDLITRWFAGHITL